MDRQALKDQVYMKVAQEISGLATCPRASVGAVLLIDGHVLSTGYNGAPAGQPHCLDVGCNVVDNHCMRAVHAEQNVFDYLPIPYDTYGNQSVWELYCTLPPCLICTQNYLHLNPIKRLIMLDGAWGYRSAHKRLWTQGGIEVTWL